MVTCKVCGQNACEDCAVKGFPNCHHHVNLGSERYEYLGDFELGESLDPAARAEALRFIDEEGPLRRLGMEPQAIGRLLEGLGREERLTKIRDILDANGPSKFDLAQLEEAQRASFGWELDFCTEFTLKKEKKFAELAKRKEELRSARVEFYKRQRETQAAAQRVDEERVLKKRNRKKADSAEVAADKKLNLKKKRKKGKKDLRTKV
jgi:hypothetical protein